MHGPTLSCAFSLFHLFSMLREGGGVPAASGGPVGRSVGSWHRYFTSVNLCSTGMRIAVLLLTSVKCGTEDALSLAS